MVGKRTRLGRLRDGQHEHRPGFDITFSAPKSVSLAALLPTEENPDGDRAVTVLFLLDGYGELIGGTRELAGNPDCRP